jgi:membrane fusion protein, multidrug efflux system
VALFAWGVLTRHHRDAVQESETQSDSSAPIPVDVVHVQQSPTEKVLSLPGQVSSFYETTIYARVSGYIHDWKKDIGDRVKKGDILAHIDTPELDDQFTAAQAKVNELIANKLVAETSAEFAVASFQRYKASAPEGAVSQEEVDQKQAELNATKARVQAAEAQVASSQAEVKRLETLRSFKDVTAPFDGVITERHIDPGALVTAGSTTNTSPLFSISQSDQVRVFVDVPQPAVADVKVGMEALVEAREFPSQAFHGNVDRTSQSIDPISKTLRVQVLVPNPKLMLLPGMYVTATFQSNRASPPLRVPASALAFGPHGPQVAVVSSDEHLSFRDVKIGRDLGDSVEIASGLEPTATVALNVGSQVSEGERVQPHLIDQAPVPTKNPAQTVTAAYSAPTNAQ